AAAGYQVASFGGLLPAPHLETVVRRWRCMVPKHVAGIVAGLKRIVDRTKIHEREVDRIEADSVDLANRLVQRCLRPRALAKLISIMVNEPVRLELSRKCFLPAQDAFPVERVVA